MTDNTRAVIQYIFAASHRGAIHFGDVIEQLLSVKVESYQVDYRAGRSTYFLPNGDTLDLELAKPEHGIAIDFDGAAVHAAVVGAQQGKVKYPEFMRLSQLAGCIGYTVWLAGRHVAYYGRKGESHIEHFPQ